MSKNVNYLHWAKVANDYTRTMLALGRSNQWGSIVQSGFTSIPNNVVQRWVTGGEDVYTLMGIVRVASYAENVAKCGNCREHAAVAFMYLFHAGIRPIEYTSYVEPGNHSFVVLGRQKALPIRYDNPLLLPEHVAICDPWDGLAIRPREIGRRMDGGWVNGFEVYYRAE